MKVRLLVALLVCSVAVTPAAGAVPLRVSAGHLPASRESGRVVVPRVTGIRWQVARRRLARLGLRAAICRVASTRPPGTVVAQRPRFRAVVARGTIVRLQVAAAKSVPAAGKVAVPDVLGELRDDAEQRLRDAGLSPHVVYTASLQLVGTVIAQNPRGGVEVASGTPITISISSGPGP